LILRETDYIAEEQRLTSKKRKKMKKENRDQKLAQKALALRSNFGEFHRFMSSYYYEDMRAWDCELITYFEKMDEISKEIDLLMAK